MPFFSSPLITAIAAVCAAMIGALVVIFVGRRSRRFQTIESSARADLSIDIDLFTRVIAAPKSDANGRTVILETRIEVKNTSRITGYIPAIYVSGHALVDAYRPRPYVGETEFDNLPECPPLSDIINVAQLQRSIFQLAPDEKERFVRWDALNEDFIRKYPVVVMNVAIFGVTSELLGETRFPRYKKGKLRDDWISLMRGDQGARHRYILFDRWQGAAEGDDGEFEIGSRYLKSCEDQLRPDIENTRKFRKVLDSVTEWSRHVTVDLTAPLDEVRTDNFGRGPNPKRGLHPQVYQVGKTSRKPAKAS